MPRAGLAYSPGRRSILLQHKPECLIDRLIARESLGEIRIKQHQIRAFTVSLSVLLRHATLQQRCTVVLGL